MNPQETEETVQANPVKHKCAVCPYSTNLLGSYKQHLISHSNEKRFKCLKCPFKSKWKCTVKQHVKTVHSTLTQSRPFPCPHPGCLYAAKQKGTLTRHSKIHSDEKSFFCLHPNCEYSTNQKVHLIHHNRTHSGEKPFVCQFESCSYASATLTALVLHTRTHTKEKPYKCPEANCEFLTAQNGQLKTHQMTHLPKEGEKRPTFPCPHNFCEYSGKSKCLLTSHMKSHSLEKPFPCSFESCEFRCNFKSNLSAHLKTHSEERRYKCELCPFRGKTRTVVTQHLQIVHSDPNLRPFKCTQPKCDSVFKRKGTLTLHLLTHQGEKNFTCSFPGCNYQAVTKSYVNDHEYNIHSEEKKEKCALCKSKCKNKTQLTHHIRIHTKERPYKCKEHGCQYRSKDSSTLRRHEKTHHP